MSAGKMTAGRPGDRGPVRGFFVTGTGTDVGKTAFTAALLRALRGRGVAAQALKPVQTGVRPEQLATSALADGVAYARAVADLPPLPPAPAATLHCFRLPASPHLAAGEEGQRLTVAGLAEDVRAHWQETETSLLLVEGAGGMAVPINEEEDTLDFMAALDLPVLLVGSNCLGALNHVLLSLQVLRLKGLRPAAVVLMAPEEPEGLSAGERHDRERVLADNPEFLRRRLAAWGEDAPVVVLPRVARLDAAGWQELADACAVLLPALARHVPSLTGQAAAVGNEEPLPLRDRRILWHPYTSVVDPLPVFAAARSHHNRIVLDDGRELVDGMSSWWTAIHGYNHPRLVAAAQRQAGRMPHVMFGGLTHAPAVELGERLLTMLPQGLARVFLADSGSVSVEVALKMALQYQQGIGQKQRTCFLTPRGGYHGDTTGAMSVCDPVTGMHCLFTHMLPRQIFMERPSCRFDQPFDPASLDDARRIFAEQGERIAAVILEPLVQGAGGMWFYHPDYLRGMARLCREHGALLVFDEIATGFGRTGTLFAAERAGVCPDILCCGKALTGGVMTLAATACTEEVAQGICRDGMVFMHGPTFMGNALACAVACASLDILAEGRWQEQVAMLETALTAGLAPCRELPQVEDVRVLGSIGVVETTRPVNMAAMQDFFVRRGVWIRPFNRLVYVMPPYVSPREDVERLCAAMHDVLSLPGMLA